MPTYRGTKAGQDKFYNLCCPPFEPGDLLAKSILTAIVYQYVFKPTPQTVFPQSWSPGWRALYHFPLPVAPTLKLYGSSSCTDKISLAASCPGLRDRRQRLEGIPFPSLFVNCSPGPRTVRMSTLQQKPLYLSSYFAPFSELTLWLQKDSPPYTTMISVYSNGATHLG